MREISTSINVCFGQGSVRRQMKRVYNAGFTAMDINFSDWVELSQNGRFFPYSEAVWADWTDEIKRFADDYGVKLNQAHGPLFNIFEEGRRGDHLRRMCEKSLRAAAGLGIPWVVFHAGSDKGDFSSLEHIRRLKEANRRFFDPLAELAEKVHVGIALENMSDKFAAGDGGMYCSHLEDLIDLADSFKSPYVGICWDTGHAHLQGEVQSRCIAEIGPRLKALHLQDSDGRSDQHTAPYYGTIDWTDVMKGLRGIHYNGDLTFESHNLIHRVPDTCKDSALALLYQIGLALKAQLEA